MACVCPSGRCKSALGFSLLTIGPRHWRYISCFHGPWLQMPIEILETIANVNYNTPRPRPMDPAALFDLVKIRRLVDEATNLAVRATGDIASPVLTDVNGGLPSYTNAGHGAKLSRERKFRMREQASQKLARAYRLDEIATSVATMQGAGTLEDVGRLVLHRIPQDPDAKYVNFFHEKIPARRMAASTSVQSLTEILSDRPTEGETLRTRAMVKGFKNDLEGAAQDLTLALSMYRSHQQSHSATEDELRLQESNRTGRRPQDVILAEKDQPSSLEGQLLFQRATTYFTLACKHAVGAVSSPQDLNNHTKAGDSGELPISETYGRGSPDLDKESEQKQVESRKLVKTYAKRALRDYMSFISPFEFAPSLPVRVAKDFSDRVNLAANGIRNPRSSEHNFLKEPYPTYSLSDLFSAVPPSNIPGYPFTDPPVSDSTTPLLDRMCQCVTYHPLLIDALHSLLLCHCLVQTSAKELLRHANMVAQLIRLVDGYPLFHASKSEARSDWIDVVRRADNWLHLSAPWETLCAPAPLPVFDAHTQKKPGPCPARAASAAAAMLSGGTVQNTTEKERDERIKEGIREQAMLDSLDHDCVHEEGGLHPTAEDCAAFGPSSPSPGDADTWYSQADTYIDMAVDPATQRWSIIDAREVPVLTERATTIAQWVREAPVVTGTTRRKKRTKRPGKAAGLDSAMGELGLGEVEAAKCE